MLSFKLLALSLYIDYLLIDCKLVLIEKVFIILTRTHLKERVTNRFLFSLGYANHV